MSRKFNPAKDPDKSPVKDSAKVLARLEADIATYLDNGGSIKRLGRGATSGSTPTLIKRRVIEDGISSDIRDKKNN